MPLPKQKKNTKPDFRRRRKSVKDGKFSVEEEMENQALKDVENTMRSLFNLELNSSKQNWKKVFKRIKYQLKKFETFSYRKGIITYRLESIYH